MVRLTVAVVVMLLLRRNKRLVEQVDEHRPCREQEQDHHQSHREATLARLRLCCFQFVSFLVVPDEPGPFTLTVICGAGIA